MVNLTECPTYSNPHQSIHSITSIPIQLNSTSTTTLASNIHITNRENGHLA